MTEHATFTNAGWEVKSVIVLQPLHANRILLYFTMGHSLLLHSLLSCETALVIYSETMRDKNEKKLLVPLVSTHAKTFQP